MMRSIILWFGALSIALALGAGCDDGGGGGGNPSSPILPPPSTGPGGPQDTTTFPDIGFEKDVAEPGTDTLPEPEPDTIPDPKGEPPTLQIGFLTSAGVVMASGAKLELHSEGEPAKYQASPGYQTDVYVWLDRAPQGTEVKLFVNGQWVTQASAQIVGGSDSPRATFEQVRVNHGTQQFRLVATTQNGTGVSEIEVSLQLDTCPVQLKPLNEACLVDDAWPSQPGFQAAFEVTTPDATCTHARLQIAHGGKITKTPAIAFMASGRATFDVTLVDFDGPYDDESVTVEAIAIDPKAPDREGSTGPIPYLIDNTPPVVIPMPPGDGVVSLDFDIDGDPNNGLQMNIPGRIEGSWQGPVALTVDGEVVSFAEPDANGYFAFKGVTFFGNGGRVLSAQVADACGQLGSESFSLEAYASQISVAFVWPSPNTPTLLALGDKDSETPMIYELDFQLALAPIDAPGEVEVVCRAPGVGGPWLSVGKANIADASHPGGLVVVPSAVNLAAFGSPNLECRPDYHGPNPNSGMTAAWTFALPAPSISILGPTLMQPIGAAGANLTLVGSQLNGQKATVALLTPEGVPLVQTQTNMAFDDNLIVQNFNPADQLGELPSGIYQIRASAKDKFGNEAGDNPGSNATVNVLLDFVAPGVSLVWPPAELHPLTAEGHIDALPFVPGFQVVPSFNLSEAVVQLCHRVNGGSTSCINPGTNMSVTLPAITVAPGVYTISGSASDAAGNQSEFSFEFAVFLPEVNVAITSPSPGAVVVEPTINVEFTVLTANDAKPVVGGSPFVMINGDLVNVPVQNLGQGIYRVNGASLNSGINEVMAGATHGFFDAASPPQTIFYKTQTPTVSISSPAHGSAINAETGICQTAAASCSLSVLGQLAHVEPGFGASLEVICNGNSATYEAAWAEAQIEWANVTFPNGSVCQLRATVEDVAGQVGHSAWIDVKVDLTPPTVGTPQIANKTLLFGSDDEDVAEPGVQISVKVEVSGAEPGSIVDVNIFNEFATVSSGTGIAVTNTVMGGTEIVDVGLLTFPDGMWTVRAQATDAAGNRSVPADQQVVVFSGVPQISFAQADLPSGFGCAGFNSCPPGESCFDGHCRTSWNAVSAQHIVVSVVDPAPTQEPVQVRVCAPAGIGGGQACNTAGHVVVGESAANAAGLYLVQVAGLPEGATTLVAELEMWPGLGLWTSTSIGHPVLIDTIAPQIESLSALTDAQPFDGWLNLAELSGGQFPFHATSNEGGTVQFYVDGIMMHHATTEEFAPFEGTFAAALNSGGPYVISARAIDAAGNASAAPGSQGAPSLVTKVDIDLPAVQPHSPIGVIHAGNPEFADTDPATPGYQVTAGALMWDPTSTPAVCIWANGAKAGCSGPTLGVGFVPGVTLQPGVNTLKAVASDEAGNTAQVQWEVTLDFAAPRVDIVSPAYGSVVGEPAANVVVQITDPTTQEPIGVDTVSLYVNGSLVASPASAGEPGQYIFSDVPLLPGPNTVMATALTSLGEGASGPLLVEYKSASPVIAFKQLGTGFVINAQTTGCAAPTGPCMRTIEAVTSAVEDGQMATLFVTCANGMQTNYNAAVLHGAANWDGVVLPDQTTCSLTASVDDVIGQTAIAGPVGIQTDRVAPAALGWDSPSGPAITWGLDGEPDPGLQVNVRAIFAGLPTGSQVAVSLWQNGVAVADRTVEITASIPDGEPVAVGLGAFDFATGWFTLKAVASDPAGNSSDELVHTAYAVATPPVATVAGGGQPCGSDSDCFSGLCEDVCRLPFNAASQKVISASFTGINFADYTTTARLCAPGLGGGNACAGVGLTEVSRTNVQNSDVLLDAAGLPEGFGTATVEVEVFPGTDIWVSSAIEAGPGHFAFYWKDTVPPVINDWAFPSDTSLPLGMINAQEMAPEGVEWSLAMNERGTLTISINGGNATYHPAVGPDFAAQGLAAVGEGEHTFLATATDRLGNQAAPKLTTLWVDTTAPQLSAAFPEMLPGQPGQAYVNPVLQLQVQDSSEQAGFQLAPSVAVLPADGVATACVAYGAGEFVCHEVAEGSNVVNFAPRTFISGTTTDAMYRVYDAAGNATELAQSIAFDWEAPVVVVQSPADSAVVATNSVNLQVAVTDGATGDPVPQFWLTAAANGSELFSESRAYFGAAHSVGPLPLLVGANSLSVGVSAAGLSSGAQIAVEYKDTAPQLAFAAPAPAVTIINGDYADCAAGPGACITDVELDSTNLEADRAATLSVNCGSGAVVYNTTTTAQGAIFAGVNLTNNSTCSLTAQATDVAGQIATANTTVAIDRTAPVLNSFTAPALSILQYYDDQDPFTPGMQRTVSVSVSGLSAGRIISLAISKGNVEQSSHQVAVPTNVADNGSSVVSFGTLTLPQGDIELVATVSDAAGNEATPKVLSLFVNSEQPLVGIVLPNHTAPNACAVSADCGAGGVCRAGTCWVGWSTSTARTMNVETAGFPWDSKTVGLRICSNHASVSGNAACSEGGYHVAATTSLNSISANVNLSALADGGHTLYAEAELYPDTGEWVTSISNGQANRKQRSVWIDTTPPSVSSFVASSDTLPPADVLNLAERNGNGTYNFAVQADENGTAYIYRNGNLASTASIVAGVANAEVNMAGDGAKTMKLVVQDEMGNASVAISNPAAPTLNLTLKATPPVLSFTSPTASPILAGGNTSVTVNTEANAEVNITNNGAPFLSGTASGAGAYSEANALVDGTYVLVATATDFANNSTVVATSPATVVVDTLPPGLILNAPAAGQYSDNDDSQPGQGGFQLDVDFSNTDGATWQIRLASNCAADYTGCGPAITKASGTMNPVGAAVPTQAVTFPVGGTEYHVLSVRVTDANGNITTESSNIRVTLLNCVVSFLNLPSSGIYNASDCGVPGCAQVQPALSAQFVGPCGNVDSVRFYKGGVEVGSDIDVGDFEGTSTYTFNDGDDVTVEAKAFDGMVEVAGSGEFSVLADFTAPTINFVAANVDGFNTAATGANPIYGLAADQNGGVQGLQFHVRLSASDNVNRAGQILRLEYDAGAPTAFAGVALPAAVANWPWQQDYKFLTLADQETYTIRAEVEDAAGNTATATFQATVDMLPPEPVMLGAIAPTDVHARRPAVRLHWAPVASNDDGTGGAAAAYEVRYSDAPIASLADWNDACPSSALAGTGALPAPGSPGDADDEFVVSGPDGRSPLDAGACHFAFEWEPNTTWHFAVRAQDAAGNWSGVSAPGNASTAALHLEVAEVTQTLGVDGDYRLTQEIHAVGDINSDGFDDAVIGGFDFSGFCVLYGHAGAGGAISDFAIGAMSGAHFQCITDANTGLGSTVAAVGDVNGDGAADLLIGAGWTTQGYDRQARVYLGTTDGSPISGVPALTIVGIHTQSSGAYGPPVGGGGNFNGDAHPITLNPLNDLLVGGNASTGRAFVIPGAASWPAATLDLLDANDREDFGVITIELQGIANAQFASRLTFAGDILPDGCAACDEIAVNQTAQNRQVILVKGRPTAGATNINFTYNTDGTGANDAEVMRLRHDSDAAVVTAFPVRNVRTADINGNGFLDLIVSHGADNRVYVFEGAKLQGKLGMEVRVTANAGTALGDDIVVGTNGYRFSGMADYAAFIGNFDDDQLVAGGTEDIVYNRYSFSSWGWLAFRFGGVGDNLGYYPAENLYFEAPTAASYDINKFGFQVMPLGDFNNDGLPDVIVSTNGAGGSAYILY